MELALTSFRYFTTTRSPITRNARCLSFFSKYINVAKSNSPKEFKDIPGPLRLPLLGNLYEYKLGKYKIEKYHKVLEDLFERYGPLVREDRGTDTIIHVFDPEDIKTVFVNEGPMPHIVPLQEPQQLYRKVRDMAGGLGNINGEEWYRLRTAVRQMMLRRKEVYYYLPLVQEVADDFVKQILKKRDKNGEIISLAEEVGKWSLESAGIVCFETRLGCMNGKEDEEEALAMVKANEMMFILSGFLKFSLPIYKQISTPKWKKLLDAEDFFYRRATQYINSTISKIEDLMQRNELPDGKYNFMTYLLSRNDLSRKDVYILTFSLFADGLRTTVPALLCSLYCLASNPEVQQKAYEEVRSHLSRDTPITYDVINKLSYLKAVMKETFRLYPVGTEISRILPKDLILSGYRVPAGSHVHLNPNVHFQSELHFKNASQFVPDRWIRGNETSTIHPFLLTPFGHGVRTCAGMRFAEQDLYVVLCLILLNFWLEYPVKKPLEQIFADLLFPEGPVRVQFISRK